MEAVLFEFAGSLKIVDEPEVLGRIQRAGVSDSNVDFYLQLLCDVNFLGIWTAEGYAFPEDENKRDLLLGIGRRIAFEKGQQGMSFQIHPAFYDVLQIE